MKKETKQEISQKTITWRIGLALLGFCALPILMIVSDNIVNGLSHCYEMGCFVLMFYSFIIGALLDLALVVLLYIKGYGIDKKKYDYSLGRFDHLYAIMWGVILFGLDTGVSIWIQFTLFKYLLK